MLTWRSGAALAMYRLGRTDEARELASEEVRLAHRWGASTAYGRALWVAGQVAGDHEGLASLNEAATVLTGSPARLELARTLIELGAALQRVGRHNESRENFRRGIELAQICGATPLIERASSELRASGARPLHIAPSGPDALTPSERRVVNWLLLVTPTATSLKLCSSPPTPLRCISQRPTTNSASPAETTSPAFPSAAPDFANLRQSPPALRFTGRLWRAYRLGSSCPEAVG